MKRIIRAVLIMAALTATGVVVARAEDPAAISQRMQARLGSVDALKQRGAVGETNKGFLEARAAVSAEESALVSAENADRAAVYAELAKRTGASADEVGRTRARKIAANSAPGIWLQDEAGNWHRK